MMTVPEEIELLKTYNKWRRGDENIAQPHPTEIGLAIDLIDHCAHVKHTNKDVHLFLNDYVNQLSNKFIKINKPIFSSAIEENVNDVLVINEIKHKRNEFINYQNTRTRKRGWVDAYWLKKVR